MRLSNVAYDESRLTDSKIHNYPLSYSVEQEICQKQTRSAPVPVILWLLASDWSFRPRPLWRQTVWEIRRGEGTAVAVQSSNMGALTTSTVFDDNLNLPGMNMLPRNELSRFLGFGERKRECAAFPSPPPSVRPRQQQQIHLLHIHTALRSRYRLAAVRYSYFTY